MRNEIPIIVHEYLRTIDNNELAANSELRELYNKSIELSQLEIGQHDEKELDGVESSNDNNTSMKTITEATGSLDANNNRNSIGVATQILLCKKQIKFCKKGYYCHGKICQHCKALFDEEIDGDVEG